MRIAVAGGTGVVGRHVVRELHERGHEPIVLARSKGVDLTTGAGLDAALAQIETVIDVSNTNASRAKAAVAFFDSTTTNLQHAEQRAGVNHHVALSIVGIDRVPLGYYQGKLHQEQLLLKTDTATILRATQFHEFPAQLLSRMPKWLPVIPLPVMRAQTVAARDVAHHLVDASLNAPAGRLPDLAGPEVQRMDQLVRRLLNAKQRKALVIATPLPGRAGKAMADGSLTPQSDGPRGTTTFDAWLASADAKDWL